MARRRKGLSRKQMRVGPYFISLLAITGLLWLAAFAGVGFKGFPTPKLGLDLQGGTSMTLSARLPGGGTPDAESMEQARQIIEDRVNGTGVAEPEVYIEGANNIVVNVAGKEAKPEELRAIGAPAELRFRQVIAGPSPDYSQQNPEDFEDLPEEEPTDGESSDGESSEEVDSSESPSTDESASSSPSEEPSDAPSDDPSASASEDPAAEVDPDIQKQRDEVKEIVGAEIWDQAEAMAASGQPIPAESMQMAMQVFAPFGALTAEQVAALTPEMQFIIPTIGCGQLNGRTPGTIADPKVAVVACDRATPEIKEAMEAGQPAFNKYMLAESKVVGGDIDTAALQQDQQSPGKWAVSLTFNSEGQDKWIALATETVNTQVAVVLDNVVVTAPTIQPGAANGGSVEITGDFSVDEARLLVDQLNYGSLPAAFKVETIDQVSPTLGFDQLEAGLLAGGIGLALVVLYCLLYYRVLGLVVIASLLVTTVMQYPTVVMLGQQIGLTLTLAGIAGFIVSIGITADAFVVMFERLKDEIKEGRSARSAVPRAWVRARRTIMSANVVNFLAAVVLYVLGIGAIKGFAFALGLSTIAGLVLVFLFTHPLVSLMSRGKLMSSPRLSGIHSGASVSRTTPRPARAVTPKEL